MLTVKAVMNWCICRFLCVLSKPLHEIFSLRFNSAWPRFPFGRLQRAIITNQICGFNLSQLLLNDRVTLSNFPSMLLFFLRFVKVVWYLFPFRKMECSLLLFWIRLLKSYINFNKTEGLWTFMRQNHNIIILKQWKCGTAYVHYWTYTIVGMNDVKLKSKPENIFSLLKS